MVGICLLLEYWELIVGTAAVWAGLWFLSGQGGLGRSRVLFA